MFCYHDFVVNGFIFKGGYIMNKKEPVRIAHVIGQMVNGGVEAVVFNYYRRIDKSKYQFDFFYDTDSTLSPPQDLIDMGARFYLIPAYSNPMPYMKALTQLFKENKYNIVHSHMNSVSVFVMRSAKKAGVPIRLAHSHSTAAKGETKKNIIKYMLRPFSKTYPTYLAACSVFAGEWLFGKKAKFEVFNNAIEIEKFKFDEEIRNELRNKLDLSNKFVIGHVGRFCYQKNQEFLVDVFKEYSLINDEAVLMLVGDGENMEMIKEQVNKLNLNDKVKFIGSVTDVYRYYQAMDMFLFPSRFEGLGMVAIEAQVSGMNVICSSDVPKEAQITDKIKFISLSEDAKNWASQIVDDREIKRETDNEKVDNSGYCIETEVLKLENRYDKLLSEIQD